MRGFACARSLAPRLSILFALAACGVDGEWMASDAGRREDASVARDAGCLGACGSHEGLVEGVRAWYLAGDALTPSDRLVLRVRDRSIGSLNAVLDGADLGALVPDAVGLAFEHSLDGVSVGDHELVLRAAGATEPYATLRFRRSHPLYVVVSNDWDTADTTDAELAAEDDLHELHPALVLTHLVGPYTFTDPTVSPARVARLVEWLTRARDDHGDEIGLHIHPYCNFVSASGVTCRNTPQYAASTRGAGYTVPCTAYTEDEFGTLLRSADALFMSNGLGKPTSFRAGAWMLGLHTLRALEANGYVVDTSAANWRRLEEWRGAPGTSLYSTTMSIWSSIDERSQPYYPADDDLLAAGSTSIGILEAPDNGTLADYVSAEEMLEMLGAIWDGGALEAPLAYSIGYHAVSLPGENYVRIDDTLRELDLHLASEDAGPIVYARLSDLALVWPP